VVPRALGVLERAGATATFLFMGSTAAAHPGAVRAVAEAGHEPACRTWKHASIDGFTPDSFREDVSQSIIELTRFL
ncbi:MAG: polysaccharide deacetylase family protein, partial [Bacteroidota bacterium]